MALSSSEFAADLLGRQLKRGERTHHAATPCAASYSRTLAEYCKGFDKHCAKFVNFVRVVLAAARSSAADSPGREELRRLRLTAAWRRWPRGSPRGRYPPARCQEMQEPSTEIRAIVVFLALAQSSFIVKIFVLRVRVFYLLFMHNDVSRFFKISTKLYKIITCRYH